MDGPSTSGRRAPRRRIGAARWCALAGATVALALGPASAVRAAVFSWGSNLTAAATVIKAFQQDSLYTPTALAGSTPAATVAPAPGQIVSISVKGTALPNTTPGAPPPLNTIHFQDLQPQPDGSYLIHASSQPFALPDSGDPNQVSVYHPDNLCVNAGDRVALNTEGGFDPNFYPDGVGFQVFGSVAGSTTGSFVGHNLTMNGDFVALSPFAGTELLMRMVEATGPDATPLCPGGTAGGLPPPVLGRTVNIATVSGTVYVKLPGAHGAQAHAAGGPLASASLTKGQGFIPLTQARQIPVGSVLDTTAGIARITTATAVPGQTQFGDFGAGIFTLLQSRKQRGLAQLNLTDRHSPRQVCATTGKKAAAAKLSASVLGLLRSSVHGRFTTRGRYSSATVRGTEWTIADKCAGTLTRVTRGAVAVDDFRRHKTIIVTAGQSYLAKAPAVPVGRG